MLCGLLCCFRFHETTKVFSLTPNKETYELDLFFHNKKKKLGSCARVATAVYITPVVV